jgi:hypothetical protein
MCTDRGAITERADRPAMKVAAFQRPRGTLTRDRSRRRRRRGLSLSQHPSR